ncbi:hypothetical protein QFW77_02035 [Luteimonas sp. RD2P54]|uniref:Sel1 repeat family protein n=1 Tax=Luteimonas endophytica TaxID=3042023 RepID=A0ABT6J4N0_9GAMM|nr:hypothetical protein [Luteimonas endophytica]MDH5821776.1 hypothetical protein [Luteimonas endophytica]
MKTKSIYTIAGTAVLLTLLAARLAPFGDVRPSPTPMSATAKEPTRGSRQKGSPGSAVLDIPVTSSPATEASLADARTVEEFRQAQQCFFDRSRGNSLKQLLIDCESLVGMEEFVEQYEECSAYQNSREDELLSIEGEDRKCDGSNEELKQEYALSVDAAAASGDPDAQMCFLHLARDGSWSFDNSDDRTEQYSKAAFSRGDWRIVKYVQELPLNSNSAVSRVFGNDMSARYRMNRLLRKGAEGDFALALDRLAEAEIGGTSWDGKPMLEPSSVIEAERWANEAYRKYYRNSPALSAPPVLCAHPAAR